MCRKLMYSILFFSAIGLSNIAQADIETGLVAWWALDDGAGETARDSASHSSGPHHGTLEGPVWETADAIVGSGSVLFDGVDDRIIVEPFDVAGTGITMALWHKPFVFTSGRLISKDGPDGTSYWYIRTNDAGRNNGGVRTNAGLGSRWFPGRVAMQLDEWNHIVFTWDQNDPGLGQFIDGEQARANPYGSSEDNVASGPDAQVAIGNWSLNTDMFVNGLIDDVRIYERGLSREDVMELFEWNGSAPNPGKASIPSPAENETDVPSKNIVLSWAPGEGADQHDVYFGTSFDDVNEAAPLDAAYLGRQVDTSYALDTQPFGQDTYWRIDEVDDTTSNVVRGDVWQFKVEPVAYAVADITATASSSDIDQVPENTINGVGLDNNDLHSGETTEMWLSSPTDTNAAWIQYDLGHMYKLHEMLVWNHNTALEQAFGLGIREAIIETSVDGIAWSPLGTTHEFAQAMGLPGSSPETIVDMSGVAVQYVRITAQSNWGGLLPQYGLSEVRFLYIPVLPRDPNPESGATNVAPDAILSWRAGRDAASHEVYLGTEPNALSSVGSVTEASFTGADMALSLGQEYHWRIDEVNEAEAPTRWEGELWSFSTPEYLVVDDFESYNDIPSGEEGSNLVYETWKDGFDNPAVNGSTVGYVEAFQPSMESEIVYDGSLSMPMTYNNSTAPISEATRTFASAKDWTLGLPKTLVVYVAGNLTNSGGGQLYLKINGVKITFDGDPAILSRSLWTQWNVDLETVGTDLARVNTLTIGIEGAAAQGILYVDEMRLYSNVSEPPVAQDPGAANLVAYYAMDNNALDGSGNGNNGTLEGNAQFVSPGWDGTGAALQCGGTDDRITVPSLDVTGSGITLMAWIKPRLFTNDSRLISKATSGSTADRVWMLALGGFEERQLQFSLRTDTLNNAGETVSSTTGYTGLGALMPLDEWSHVAVTWDVDDPVMRLYHNLNPFDSVDKAGVAVSVASDVMVGIGNRSNSSIVDPAADARPFDGLIDEVRIYDRRLSPGELLHIAISK